MAKEKTTLLKFLPFQLYEGEAVKEYLEDMALKGWKLKSIGTFLKFEKIEPQKLIYSVEVFNKASVYDIEQTFITRPDIESWQKAGWEHIATSGKLAVFMAADQNSTPQELSESERFQNVFYSTLSKNVWLWLYWPIFILWSLFSSFGISYYDFKSFITSQFAIFIITVILLSVVFIALELIWFAIWCLKSKIRFKKGRPLYSVSKQTLQRRKNFRLAFGAVLLLFILFNAIFSFSYGNYVLGIFLLLLIPIFYRFKRRGFYFKRVQMFKEFDVIWRVVTGIIAIVLLYGSMVVFSSYKVNSTVAPLALEDFGITAELTESEVYHDKSVLAESYDCTLDFEQIIDNSEQCFVDYTKPDAYNRPNKINGTVDYKIYISNNPLIIQKCAELILKENAWLELSVHQKANLPAWGAKEVYVPNNRTFGDVIVVYDNLIFTYNEPLTDEQIAHLAQKLKTMQ